MGLPGSFFGVGVMAGRLGCGITEQSTRTCVTDNVEPSSSLSVRAAGTPVSLTLGFPPGHSKEGWKRKEVYYGWSLLFQRADERSTKFHCKGMHFKGEFKTNKILSELTTKLKGGSSRIRLRTYSHNILWLFN